MKNPIFIILTFLLFFSCASSQTKQKSVAGNQEELEKIKKIKIGTFKSQNDSISKSIQLTIIQKLIGSGFNLVDKNEDASINGIVSIDFDSVKSSDFGSFRNNFIGVATANKSSSTGQYVSGINLQIISKKGELIGSSYITQIRDFEKPVKTPIHLASDLSNSLIKELFKKDLQTVDPFLSLGGSSGGSPYIDAETVVAKEEFCNLAKISKFKWGDFSSESSDISEVIKHNITQKLMEEGIATVEENEDIIISGLATLQFDSTGGSSGFALANNDSSLNNSSKEFTGKHLSGINIQIYNKNRTLVGSAYIAQLRVKDKVPDSINMLADGLGDDLVRYILKLRVWGCKQ